jgi:hypothetical protein
LFHEFLKYFEIQAIRDSAAMLDVGPHLGSSLDTVDAAKSKFNLSRYVKILVVYKNLKPNIPRLVL